MVVKTSEVDPALLDLGYLGLFLGLRMNELIRDALAENGFPAVRQSHGYVIQHLIASELSITELAMRMQVTQQAASKMVAEMLTQGFLESVPSADRRSKSIRLSPLGWQLITLSRKTRARMEKKLQKQVGLTAYNEAQRILLQCLNSLDGIEAIKARRIRMPS